MRKDKINKKFKKAVLSLLFSIAIYCVYNAPQIQDVAYKYINQDNTLNELVEQNTINESSDNLFAYFIDVGQGNSTLIVNDGDVMLIDAGEYSEVDNVVTLLEELNITEIDYIVATHPHSDHIGGFNRILEEYKVNNVLMPKAIHTTKTYEDFVKLVIEKDIEVIVPKVLDEYAIGDAYFTVIAPNSSEYEDLNDYSIAGILTHNEVDIMLTGDMTILSEKEVLDTGINIDSEILQVAHHGSKTSNSSDFLSAVTPITLIMSVGKDNSYNLPNKDILARLNKFDIPLYRTDLLGTIELISDGENYIVK